MRSTVNRFTLLLLLAVAGAVSAKPLTALFWRAATAQDTLLVERLAPSLAIKINQSIELLSPDTIRFRLSDTVFTDDASSRTEFFHAYPEVTRIDLTFHRYGGSVSLFGLRSTVKSSDTLRLIYPGVNADVIDWFFFQLSNWLLPVDTSLTQPGTAQVVVTGSPLGSPVSVDGRSTSKIVPARIENLSEGAHLIETTGDFVAAKLVQLRNNSTIGIELKGHAATSLLEIVSDPPGLNVSVDGASSGATPFLRESPPGSYSITVGGGEYEEVSRIVDLAPQQWRILHLFPQMMNRIVVITSPPGAVIYNGPVRLGVSGDTLPCPQEGETWIADHPYANSYRFLAKGERGRIVRIEVTLPPALSYLKLQNWLKIMQFRMDDSLLNVVRPDSQQVLAGHHNFSVYTPGFRTRFFALTLDRSVLTTVDVKPVPTSNWLAISLSAVAPGFGQIYDGYRGRGSLLMIAAIITGAGYIQADNEVQNRINGLHTTEANYRRALSSSTARNWGQRVDAQWAGIKQQAKKRDTWGVIAAAVWSAAVLDRVLFPPNRLEPAQVGSGSGIRLSFAMPERAR